MLGFENGDFFSTLLERLRWLARLPVLALLVFCSVLIAWLGCVTAWRLAVYLFNSFLRRPWG